MESKNKYRITGRSDVPGNPNLIRVLFEDGESFIIQVRDFVDFHLKVNEVVSSDVYIRLSQLQNTVHALTLANRYLRFRVKTAAQVKQYLKQKNIEDETIDLVLQKLSEAEVVDDEQYASIFVEAKSKSLSRRVLKNKLLQKGVSSEIIEDAIQQLCDDKTEHQAALIAAKKYIKHHEIPCSREEKMKMGNYLARKGFSQSVIYKIIDNMDTFIQ